MPKLYLLFCCLTFAMGYSQAWAADCKLIRYATNPNYPPYGWSVGQTGYDGAAIELLRMVVPEGTRLEPAVYPWKRSQKMAEAGEIDLLLAIRPTPERQKYLAFTHAPAFPNPIVVFSRLDSSFQYHTWKDLKGWRGGKSLGDAFGREFDKFMAKELSLEEANSAEENFQKLELRRIDYFLTGLYLGRTYLTKHGLDATIKVWQPPLTHEPIFFAFSQKSPCLALLPGIDQKLKRLNDEGTPTKLLNQALTRFQTRPHPPGTESVTP